MTNSLQRFIKAQTISYEIALGEIKNGKKSSYWIWYIFPQIKDFGRSSTSKYYVINNKKEAISYYNHPILEERLKGITAVFLAIEGKSAFEILENPDHHKMKSCMTLFHSVQKEKDLFFKVLEKYYNKELCGSTVKQLNSK